MGTELIAGSQKDKTLYNSSMAKAMEDAFIKEWPSVMGDTESPAVNSHLKLMFVAIAQGVIKHLEQNKNAFIVDEINIGGTDTEIEMHEIKVRQSDLS